MNNLISLKKISKNYILNNKVKALKEAGVIVANVHHEVGELMKKAILLK